MVKKKAAMCLLQLHRKYSDFISADQWAERINQLLQTKDLGVLSSLLSLLLVVANQDPEGYECCVDTIIDLLGKVLCYLFMHYKIAILMLLKKILLW